MQQERSSSAALELIWYYVLYSATAGGLRVEMTSVNLRQPVAISTERPTDWPCALDMCNTARSFTYESNTCVIRRLVFLDLGWWWWGLLLLLETIIQYPCLRVYIAQISVNWTSRFFEFLPESNRRPRDGQSCTLTNWIKFASSKIKFYSVLDSLTYCLVPCSLPPSTTSHCRILGCPWTSKSWDRTGSAFRTLVILHLLQSHFTRGLQYPKQSDRRLTGSRPLLGFDTTHW